MKERKDSISSVSLSLLWFFPKSSFHENLIRQPQEIFLKIERERREREKIEGEGERMGERAKLQVAIAGTAPVVSGMIAVQKKEVISFE